MYRPFGVMLSVWPQVFQSPDTLWKQGWLSLNLTLFVLYGLLVSVEPLWMYSCRQSLTVFIRLWSLSDVTVASKASLSSRHSPSSECWSSVYGSCISSLCLLSHFSLLLFLAAFVVVLSRDSCNTFHTAHCKDWGENSFTDKPFQRMASSKSPWFCSRCNHKWKETCFSFKSWSGDKARNSTISLFAFPLLFLVTEFGLHVIIQ